MIYTVTFNPSLDYIVSVPNFQMNLTNRTASERMLPGGKGINVSIVLRNLGIPSTALGFAAGFTGQEIIRRLNEMQLNTEFTLLDQGQSRINMKLIDYDGTEINGMGPEIPPAALDQLMNRLKELTAEDTLVLAGSIPASLPSTIYKDIMAALADTGVRFVVDATGSLLENVLQYHPFLIKPNNHELGALFDVKLTTRESVIPYARKLQEKGARNVLVSMAGQGAVLVDENDSVHLLPAPKGKLVNAVGAGDSMVAGFLAGWEESHDYEQAFRTGISAGSASAFSEDLATGEEVLEVMKQLSSADC